MAVEYGDAAAKEALRRVIEDELRFIEDGYYTSEIYREVVQEPPTIISFGEYNGCTFVETEPAIDLVCIDGVWQVPK